MNNNISQNTKTWLTSNLWNILSLIVVTLIAAIYLKTEVKANTSRINALEQKIAKYPSKDWFELKFQNIDERFDTLEGVIN